MLYVNVSLIHFGSIVDAVDVMVLVPRNRFLDRSWRIISTMTAAVIGGAAVTDVSPIISTARLFLAHCLIIIAAYFNGQLFPEGGYGHSIRNPNPNPTCTLLLADALS